MPADDLRNILLATHLAFDFSREAWETFARSGPSDRDAFRSRAFRNWKTLERPPPDTLATALAFSAQVHCRRITCLDPDYPTALRELPGAPPVLYLYGRALPEPSSLVAIVGTRRPSAFGTTVANELGNYLAGLGLGIVSGLARGIDAIAHSRALAARAYTLAVLGSGIERIYPSEHDGLARALLEAGGTLLSQYPPAAIPHPTHFPRRNRLIAALSAGTCVVEGSPKSGALITGREALDQGRTAVVFTQDFRGDFGKGAIELVLNGAHPALGYADALRAIAQTFGGRLRPLGSPGRKLRLRALAPAAEFTLFEFQNARGLPLRDAIVELEKLRAAGKVTGDSGGRYYWQE